MNPEFKNYIDGQINKVYDIENKIKSFQNGDSINLKEKIRNNNRKIKENILNIKVAKIEVVKTRDILHEFDKKFNASEGEERNLIWNEMQKARTIWLEKTKEFKNVKSKYAEEERILLSENIKLHNNMGNSNDLESLNKQRRKELNDIAQFCYKWMNEEVE